MKKSQGWWTWDSFDIRLQTSGAITSPFSWCLAKDHRSMSGVDPLQHAVFEERWCQPILHSHTRKLHVNAADRYRIFPDFSPNPASYE